MDTTRMIETIEFEGKEYPKFQSEGNAARFVSEFAKQVCKGWGYDIGCGKKDWLFNNAFPIDIALNDGLDALHLPNHVDGSLKLKKVDYIFSSHCLEHLPNWVEALDYWTTALKHGGVLFLYLPHKSQGYWKPWNNRKHIHVLTAKQISKYLKARGWKKIFTTGKDLNNSFIVMAEKA